MTDYELDTEYTFDCRFEVNVVACNWGNIEGDINDQTDLKDALDNKADDTEITEIDGRLDTIEGTLSGYGNIVTHDTDEFATAAQGALADSAVQPSDLNNYVPNTRTVNGKALSFNITLNYSDVGALASTTTINDLTTTAQQNVLNSGITSSDVTLIGTALQPNDNITQLTNNAGYITGITSSDISTALGYTPQEQLVSATNIKTINGASILGSGDLQVSGTNSADKQLSNLDTTGNNRLHALKGYTESGQVYSDTTLYNDILAQYNNSPFDLSKFTVVGTPTITNEGVASGFSTSNYVSLPSSYTLGTDFELFFPIKLSNLTTETQIYRLQSGGTFRGLVTFAPSYGVMVNLSDGTYSMSDGGNKFAISDTDIIANEQYLIVIKQHNQTCSYGYIRNGVYTENGTIANFNINMPLVDTTYIGRGNSSAFTGSIDLKLFSITVDGVEVFSGHKTGTDLIITDNYTVVGSLMINDGWASGFTNTSNWITTGNFTNNLGDYDNWEIDISTITASTVSATYFAGLIKNFIDDTNVNAFTIIGNSDKKFTFYMRANDDTWIAYQSYSTVAYDLNSPLDIKIRFTGTKYEFLQKTTGQDWSVAWSVNSTKKLKKSTKPFTIGSQMIAGNSAWNGSINLYSIRFVGDGKLLYAGKCQIPYNISDNGNKITDVQYRPDVYYANYLDYKSSYFTIDTVNQNVTLPYKNLYSLINQSLNYNYKLIQGYDGTATQTLKHVSGVLQWVTD